MTARKTTTKTKSASKATTAERKPAARKATARKKAAAAETAPQAPRDLPPGWEDATPENGAQGARPAPKDAAPTPKDDSQELVVFAMRLTRAERDLIHAAAGSGKASGFVRGVAVAAAQRDTKALQEVIKEAEARRAQ